MTNKKTSSQKRDED